MSIDGAPEVQTGAESLGPELISVVIPLYNPGDALEPLLLALAAQTYRGAWEIVVADNGSTDGSRLTVDRFRCQLPPVRIVDAAERRGASYARNVGASVASGELLLFCDADDLVDEGWVEHMASAADKADLLICSDDLLDEGTGWDPPHRNMDRTSFSFLPWGRGGCIGVRTETFASVGGFDESLVTGQDVEFCWRVQVAGYECELVDEAVVYYRLRSRTTDLVRQQFRFGKSSVNVHRRFRQHGKPSPPLREVLRGYAWTVTRAPLLLWPHRRRVWIILTMQRLGRLWGSITYRVWYP